VGGLKWGEKFKRNPSSLLKNCSREKNNSDANKGKPFRYEAQITPTKNGGESFPIPPTAKDQLERGGGSVTPQWKAQGGRTPNSVATISKGSNGGGGLQ